MVGPSASGKSRMAVEVALELDAGVEIVSCDSMAVYRGLDIAADKPSVPERRGVPHHLIDVASPDETFTAVRYRDLARQAFADIASRGGVPMLVGGSGLWFRAAVDDLEFAPSDAGLRVKLEAADPEELWSRLVEADPDTAVDRRNVRRLVRAVEILELTGRPPSSMRTTWEARGEVTVCALTWDREELFRRAAARVRAEMDAGLVEEVRRVRDDTGISRTAWQALGVKEVLDHLDGRLDREECIAANIRNTKSFIRKQLGWFRADPRVTWVDASELGWDGARERLVSISAEAIRRMGVRDNEGG